MEIRYADSATNNVIHNSKDVELGRIENSGGGRENRSSYDQKGPRTHFDYGYNEEAEDRLQDIAESTNSLIFSKFYSSIFVSHLVLLSQICASVVILQVPYQVYHYHGGAGSWLTLFGILIMSSEVFSEWNDLSRHLTCYLRQSRVHMLLTAPHLLLVLTMSAMVPLVICKNLASANYNDPIGVLTSFTGIFILFDADGQLFTQLRYSPEDSRVSTRNLIDLKKYKTFIALVFIPCVLFIVFECYFISRKHCGDLLTGDTASSKCEDVDD